MTKQGHWLLTGAALSAALFAIAVDADAGGKRRGRRGKRHHFKTQPAPAKASTPALASDGSVAGEGSAPVASGALDGEFRQDVVDGGVLLAMGPDRALALSWYRGLSLIDTSDPASPRVLASVAVEGTGQRMFLGDGEVAVLSDAWDATGARTRVTSVAVGESSLTPVGSATVEGWLVDAARQGADLLLVTSNGGWWGPVVAFEGDASGGGGNALPGAPRKRGRRAAPRASRDPATGGMHEGGIVGDWLPWYPTEAQTHVARFTLAADAAPSLAGTVELAGSPSGQALTGDDAVLALQSYEADTWNLDVELVRVMDGAGGAPEVTATLDLGSGGWLWSLDRRGDVLRALSSDSAGAAVATFDLAGGALAAQDSFSLGTWPAAFAFTDAAFVYGETTYDWEETPPRDPALDPDGVADAFGGMKAGPGAIAAGPSSSLHCVDLRDPADIVQGGSLDVGAGWLGGLTAVEGGVVGTRFDWDTWNGATTFFRAATGDPQSPSLADSEQFEGWLSPGPVLGDLMLVNGGEVDDKGSFLATTRLVDLADGGLAIGGAFDAGSWTAAAAREGDLLGIASFDRVTFVDIADPANPDVKGHVRLIVNVAGFAALSDTAGAALVTDYLGGTVEIRTVALPEADAFAPLDVLSMGTGDAQLFAAAPFLYVVATDWSTGRASVHVVDASDPADLRLRDSLDLAAYPGQVFLKGEALLMLRQAYALFEENDQGRLKGAADAFGRCPRSWLRDELTAVLDVVDLRDPDALKAAERLRMRWDWGGPAVLAGDSLYVPAYVFATDRDDPYEQVAYQIREIDVTDPLDPSAKGPVDVPGTLVAATNDPHRVLTAEYLWDETTGATSSKLHLVDLSLPWQERVLATQDLAGYPGTVTVGAEHAYVVNETWGVVAGDGSVRNVESSASLATFDLGGGTLALASTTERESGAWGGEIAGGTLFLRTWGWMGSLDLYSLADPAAPSFVKSQDVVGLQGPIVVRGGRAYLAAGLYGIQSFALSD